VAIDVTSSELVIHCDGGIRAVRRTTDKPVTYIKAHRPPEDRCRPVDGTPSGTRLVENRPMSSPWWQGRTITDSPIPQLLTARPAIVVERIARGGGRTEWYRCLHQTHLAAITAQLSPGSIVSFYFDQRIAHRRYTPDLHRQIIDLMDRLRALPGETGEIVFGQLGDDELHIQVDFPAGAEDLDELTSTLGTHSWIYYGPFPARDNDGVNAITLTLPDNDGIVRRHPH
jgi:hypothetical protein